jgi:peptide deformylase
VSGAAVAVLDAVALASARNVPGPLYELRYLGDPILNQVCTPVESSQDVGQLVDALRRIRDKHSGLGLSANQVGSTLRVFVALIGPKHDRKDMVFVNPRLVAGDEPVLCTQEGCLSLPGFRTSVKRLRWIEVEFESLAGGYLGAQWRMKFEGLDAQVVQHEIDHLDGVLLTDRVSRQQRRQAERIVAAARAKV